MKKRNKILITLVALVLVLISACSSVKNSLGYPSIEAALEVAEAPASSSDFSQKKNFGGQDFDDYENEMDSAAMAPAPETGGVSVEAGGGQVEGVLEITSETPATQKRKLVITTNLTLETKEFDEGTARIEALVESIGGYIEYMDLQGIAMNHSGASSRYAQYTVRIPANGAENFVKALGTEFHTVSESRSAQDITAGYYDTETQLQTLLEQEERLNKLLDAGGDLKYLLEIQREISNIRYQINSINNQLKNMDSMVDFSTVNIYLTEVVDYVTQPQIKDTFGTRVSRAFSETWTNFVDGSQNFTIGLILAIPTLIILAILGIIAFIIWKRIKKKRLENPKPPHVYNQAGQVPYPTAQQQVQPPTPVEQAPAPQPTKPTKAEDKNANDKNKK